MPMLRKVFIFVIIIVFSFSSLSLSAEPVDPHDPRTIYYEWTINPKGTYLRTCDDFADISIIPIGEPINVYQGDWVVLRRYGYFQPAPGQGDFRGDLIGVFSGYGTLLPDEVNRPNRLRDTIYADRGYAFPTKDTWYACVEDEAEGEERLSTDIPQDFYISPCMLQIPSGAEYLYLTTNEGLHYDNSDPNGDFRLRFTDEVRWADRGYATNWFTGGNWDTWYYPRPEFGVSFDEPGYIPVSGAAGLIKYLRIVEGYVDFDFGTDLTTTLCDGTKIPFIVGDSHGARMDLRGKLNTCYGYIGYQGNGELYIAGGGSLEVINGIAIGAEKGSTGQITVLGEGSLLKAGGVSVGFKDGGYLYISLKAQVQSTGDIWIGGGIDGSFALVFIETGGGLAADNRILINDRGTLHIDGGGVAAGNGIFVREGGGIGGCNSGIVSGLVFNEGGSVGPGCSIGTLIIDGNYVQEAGGTLEVEVGGYNRGEDYDLLEVTGDVTLNGTLQVNFVNGFAPKQGDVFEFTKVTGSASQNLSKVEINCVASDFQHKTELVGGKLTMTALNDARAIPCGGPKAMPWIQLLLLED